MTCDKFGIPNLETSFYTIDQIIFDHITRIIFEIINTTLNLNQL